MSIDKIGNRGMIDEVEVRSYLVGLLDFKSSGGRRKRPRWVRFPCTSANM